MARMTAVLLAAGRGRRLQASDAATLTAAQRDTARRGLKALMPVGHDDRPLLHYSLDRLAAAGCDDAVIVVPAEHDDVHIALTRWTPALSVRLVVQPRPEGTADAVAVGASAVTDDAFLVVNGDNLYPVEAIAALAALDTCGLAAFTRAGLERDSGFTTDRVAAFAAVDADDDGWLLGLREKPTAASLTPPTRMSLNLWRLDRAVAAACHDVAPSARGERELPDAVQLAVARGTRVRVVDVVGTVLDLTSAADVPAVSRALTGTAGGR